MSLNTEEVKNLEKELNIQKALWGMKIDQYYKAYANEKMQNNYVPGQGSSGDFFDNLINIETKLRTISEKLESHLTVTSSTISSQSDKLKEIRNGRSSSIQKMKEYIDRNKSSNTRKIDKLDEKSRAYLTTTFYSVSLITMSFFIYKQLKQ
tara:strand:- start:19894 stop:20346 length:453 start_codon:yes stop_codon:yes gene_type:complete